MATTSPIYALDSRISRQDARDLNDVSGAMRAQVRLRVELSPHLLVGQLLGRSLKAVAGVVDDNVEPPEPHDRVGEGGLEN